MKVYFNKEIIFSNHCAILKNDWMSLIANEFNSEYVVFTVIGVKQRQMGTEIIEGVPQSPKG